MRCFTFGKSIFLNANIDHGRFIKNSFVSNITDVLKVFDVSYMVSLNLEINSLSTLESEVFHSARRLEYLDSNQCLNRDLSNTQLDHLMTDALVGLPKLKDLDLRFNELEVLPSQLFNQNPKVQDLKLSNNKINTIHNDTFAGLGELWTLAVPTEIEHYKERFKPSLAAGARYDLIVGPSTMSCHSSAVPTEIEHYKERFKPSLAAGARYDLIVGPSTMSCHSSAVPTEIEHYKERFKPSLAAGARQASRDITITPRQTSRDITITPRQASRDITITPRQTTKLTKPKHTSRSIQTE
ncbi:hypothetical protein RRG08_004904 [Elysia crispata]|uniref:Uncharacterized protein n=1 Tax=Elysia crispata TaxID=231223 RepID=A0AAE1DGG6_9GAST|nr:hypothetical protein RRG08_004904 [Elysia crispata]